MADELTLKYEGGPVAEGEFDALSVGGAILGFGEFAGIVGRLAYAEPPQIRTTVRGLRNESFDIEFAIYITATAAPLFPQIATYLEFLKSALDLLKHLGGNPARSTSPAKDAPGMLAVENNHGVIVNVVQPVLNLAQDKAASRAAEAFVREPCERGVEHVSVVETESDRPIVEFDAEQARSVRIVDTVVIDERVEIEQVSEKWLLVEAVYFRENRRTWRFYDGSSRFPARIDDEVYMRAVESGSETFASGDQLRVRLRSVQSFEKGQPKMYHVIERVLEHRRQAQQISLFPGSGSDY